MLLVYLAVFLFISLSLQWLYTRLRDFSSGKGSRSSAHDLERMAPYPPRPIRGRGTYRVMMDVRKLDQHNWLTMDKNYMDEHRVRARLLEAEKPKVFQVLPESREACTEALTEVVAFLCERYPWMFESTKKDKETAVHNKKTGETFIFGGPNSSMEPLEVAVRLSMEDLSILIKNADDEYYLYVLTLCLRTERMANDQCRAASGSLFPVGWAVAERIGWTVTQLHSPVPLWKEQVSASVSK